jgi:transcription elongation factor Elf1
MKYACPKCGSEDVSVIRCYVEGDMPLAEDGFVVYGSTSEEVVMCKNCDHKARIGDFIKEND